MKLGLAVGPRILLSDSGAELDVLADGLPERCVVREPSRVERLHIQGGEALSLLVADP
jgi:hypothetical protein